MKNTYNPDDPFLPSDEELENIEAYAERLTPVTPLNEHVITLVCACRSLKIERDEWRRRCADLVERGRQR